MLEKFLIYSLTTPMPLSSEALSSKTIELYLFSYIYLAHATIVEVLPK
jgi:hypothetical protein